MKNFRNKTLIILLIFIGLSCNEDKFFELKRPVQPPWSSVEEFELAAREPYIQMLGKAWTSPLGTISLKNFSESDVVQQLEGISGDNYYYEYYNRLYKTVLPGKEISWCFPELYGTILNCNGPLTMLANAEAEGRDPFPDMTANDWETVNRYKGELLFMRGVAYWHLARMYAPPFDPAGANDTRHFVLRREFTNSSSELKDGYLGTVAEVWAGIQEDLENAKSLLPESYVTTELSPKGRANRFAAAAFLSRVYFITGQYAKAKAECDYVIGGPYNLNDDPIEAFNRNAAEGSSNEVIWEIPFYSGSNRYERIPTIISKCNYSAKNGGRGSSWSRCTWANHTMAYSTLKQIGWMADGQNGDYTEIPTARDDKRYVQVYYRLEGYKPIPDGLSKAEQNEFKNIYETSVTSITEPQVWLDKYFRATDGRRSSRPMLRLAEFYLTRSILRFNEGDKIGAAADVNVVRHRAGLADIDSGVLTAQDIHNERIKEMSGEGGDRTYYLIALRLPIGIGDRDPAQFSPIMPPYSDYYWQVPLEEQQLNQAYNK